MWPCRRIAARPVACSDPIHDAISRHREAAYLTDAENAALTAAGGPDVADWRPLQHTVEAEVAAARTMIATTPSTVAGLEALERPCGPSSTPRLASTSVAVPCRAEEMQRHGWWQSIGRGLARCEVSCLIDAHLGSDRDGADESSELPQGLMMQGAAFGIMSHGSPKSALSLMPRPAAGSRKTRIPRRERRSRT